MDRGGRRREVEDRKGGEGREGGEGEEGGEGRKLNYRNEEDK